jgi:putative transposase
MKYKMRILQIIVRFTFPWQYLRLRMANTYTQIHIHAVFAVRYRRACIDASWKEELHKYICGIVRNNEHKTLAINSMPDHMHLLIGLRPSQSLSDLMKDVKGSSSKWINERNLCAGAFKWQEGYGAFAVNNRGLSRVATYIEEQEAHHLKTNFRTEYLQLLNEEKVDFQEKFIFSELEQV